MSVGLLPEPTVEQEMLLDATERFVEAELPMAAVRARADGVDGDGLGAGPGLGYLRAAAGLGWFGMLAGEAHGGGSASGNGLVDAAAIAAERAARLQPGPFTGHNVVVHALSQALAGSRAPGLQRDVLAELVEGRGWATWIADGPLAGADGQRIALVTGGDGLRLDGTAEVVAEADGCAWFLGDRGGGGRADPGAGAGGRTRGHGPPARRARRDPALVRGRAGRGRGRHRRDRRHAGRGDRAARRPPAPRRLRAVGGRSGRGHGRRLPHGARLRQGPDRLRPPDRVVPGGEAPARRHQPLVGDGQGHRGGRRPGGRPGGARRSRAGPRGQVVRGGPQPRPGPQLLPGVRRDRLHVGARPAPLPAAPRRGGGDPRSAGPAPPPAVGRDGRCGHPPFRVRDISFRRDIPYTEAEAEPEADAEGDLAAWRAQARAWLEANLERRTGEDTRSALLGGAADRSPESLGAQRRLQRKLHEAGYAGITWPREYGGRGLPPEYERAFDAEARAFVLPDLGVAGGATFGVCARTMLAHASPDFLRRTIPRILAGDAIVAQFFSDPEAGSDLAGVRTRAVRDGDRWILNGSKIWSSGAWYADYGMCLARTDWDVPKHRGLTWFLVPTTAEGVTVRRIRQINGDAEFCQEFFDDVELSDDDVIGPVNGGWAVTQTMLLFERGGGGGGIGSTAPTSAGGGIAPDLVELAMAAGRLDDPVVRDLIARAHVDDLVRKAFVVRLGGLMRVNPALAGNLASYGKLASGTFDPIRANLAMQIGGQAAVAWEAIARSNGDGNADGADPPGARTATGLLNSRFLAIAGGTNEVQRNSVGERVLGLPREPAFDTRKPFRDVLRDAQSWSGQVG